MQYPIRFRNGSLGTAVVLLCTAIAAAAPMGCPSGVPNGKASVIGARPRLTRQQKQGIALLKIAQSEALGLQPDMRAFVLWQVSRGYMRVAPAKSDLLLKNAFRTTLLIEKANDRCTHSEADFCGAKYWLQKRILRDLIGQCRRLSEIQPLLISAEPEVQRTMNAEMFHRFVREKEFEQARELLYRMSNENGYFSYNSATELIEALPKERSQDRIGIFSRALEAYEQHTDEKYPSVDDPAIMLVRVWASLPPSLVLSAIDQIFDRAKDVDEDRANDADNQQQDLRVGISSSKGGAHFSSVYQFRLFQLMPILEQLDQSQAESLLSQNGDVQAALEHYPQGVDSMNASSNTKAQSNGRFMTGIVNIGAQDAVDAAADENLSEIFRRQQQILSEAETDPQQALSDAMRLPLDAGFESENNFRVSTLKSVARISALKDPAVSGAALGEVRKVAKNLPVRNQAQILAEVPEIYLRLHDETGVRSSLSELVEVARKLYDQDSDSYDPNEAFKGMWPSANLWRHCVAVAAKLTPSPAEEIVKEIPDPEIKTFERVALANSLLGAEFVPLSTLEKHKNGIRASMGF